MSDEYRVPSELVGIQSRLAQLSPRPSRIDQDALMYQAGWQAATQRATRRRWIVPIMSAAAAALLVATMLPRNYVAKVAPVEHDAQTADVINRSPVVPPRTLAQRRRTITGFSVRRAPLLAMRERALRSDMDELPLYDVAAGGRAANASTSLLQLREELLPR